jgi:thioredoxin reductase (NADPH)
VRDFYELAIIGGGPAGLTAGIYGARAGLSVGILEKQFPGGQVVATDSIENFPGIVEPVNGFELARRMEKQVEAFGAEIVTAGATSLEDAPDGENKLIGVGEQSVLATAVIVATGASYRKIGIPGEDRFWGKGISCCATCDGAFYRDKEVVVVGGGDTAVKESIFLTRFVKKLTLIHRRDRLRATKTLQDRLVALQPQVEFRWDTVAEEIVGREKVTGVAVRNLKSGQTERLPCDGVFVFVGFVPNTEFVRGYLETDEKGYITTDQEMATSVPGIYACGDVRKKSLRQIITACGEGATAAFAAQHYIDEKKGTLYEQEFRGEQPP